MAGRDGKVMFRVNDKAAAKVAYFLINVYGNEPETAEYATDKYRMIHLKKEVRRWQKTTQNNDYEQYFLREKNDYADGGWVKFVFPSRITEPEAAERYYDCNLKREFENSAYDCTGSHETSHEIFYQRSDGRIVMYYYEAIDV